MMNNLTPIPSVDLFITYQGEELVDHLHRALHAEETSGHVYLLTTAKTFPETTLPERFEFMTAESLGSTKFLRAVAQKSKATTRQR